MSILGSMAVGAVGGGLDLFGGLLNNSAQKSIASANRRFAERMYRNRYQYTMEDLRAAGLNPVLAANGGSVTGQPTSASVPNLDNALGNAAKTTMSTALDAMSVLRSKSDRELTDAQRELTEKKSLEQDIRNEHLPELMQGQAQKALADASFAHSAAVQARALEEYADSIARTKAATGIIDWNLKEQRFKSNLDHSQARELKYRREFFNTQAAAYRRDMYRNDPRRNMSASELKWLYRVKAVGDVIGKGVNSAIGVGKFRRLVK